MARALICLLALVAVASADEYRKITLSGASRECVEALVGPTPWTVEGVTGMIAEAEGDTVTIAYAVSNAKAFDSVDAAISVKTKEMCGVDSGGSSASAKGEKLTTATDLIGRK